MTPLTKPLKREVKIKGRPFVITLSPEGVVVTLKGKRKGQELRWEDLVSGDAALAVALNATLSHIPQLDDGGPKRGDKLRPKQGSVEKRANPKSSSRNRSNSS